ncbi:hypothetical protein EV641_12738 [Rhodococcus sp. SMB37]|nr:hypothetical protein EV641_12738 [Rhodococcus sp. SMB37]
MPSPRLPHRATGRTCESPRSSHSHQRVARRRTYCGHTSSARRPQVDRRPERPGAPHVAGMADGPASRLISNPTARPPCFRGLPNSVVITNTRNLLPYFAVIARFALRNSCAGSTRAEPDRHGPVGVPSKVDDAISTRGLRRIRSTFHERAGVYPYQRPPADASHTGVVLAEPSRRNVRSAKNWSPPGSSRNAIPAVSQNLTTKHGIHRER